MDAESSLISVTLLRKIFFQILQNHFSLLLILIFLFVFLLYDFLRFGTPCFSFVCKHRSQKNCELSEGRLGLSVRQLHCRVSGQGASSHTRGLESDRTKSLAPVPFLAVLVLFRLLIPYHEKRSFSIFHLLVCSNSIWQP